MLAGHHDEVARRDVGGRRDCLLDDTSVRGKPNPNGRPTIRLERDRISGNAEDSPHHRRDVSIAGPTPTAGAWSAVTPSARRVWAHPDLNLPGFQDAIAFLADGGDPLASLDVAD